MNNPNKLGALGGFGICLLLCICAAVQLILSHSAISVLLLLLSLINLMIFVRNPAKAAPAQESADMPANHPNTDFPGEEPIGWRQDNRQLLGFIERLLKGCENQRISGVQIPVQSPFFVVFGIDILAFPNQDAQGTEAMTMAEMRICNVFAEAFSQHSFWPMNIDGLLTCVVNLRPVAEDPLQSDAMEQVVIPAMRRVTDTLLSEDIRIRIATSGLSVGLDSLSQAYQDTIDIFDQLILMSPACEDLIVMVNPHENSLPSNHITRAQTERLFCNYITTQDFENARLSLLKLTEYEAADQNFSLVIKKLTENRLAWSLTVLSTSLTQPQYQQLSQKIQELSGTAYMDELTKGIDSWFEQLQSSFNPQPKDSLVPNVINYVAENCLSPELSVSQISEQFQVSASYLSSSFHSQTGMRLIDFIHQQRLRKVKQLLRETDLTIAQIAESTGYYNAMTMSRAFKRYEGITPSAYRDQ